MGPIQIFWMILSFLIILSVSFVLIYFIGTQYSKLNKTKNMAVVETLSLGVDKALHLVKLGNQYYVIGVTKQNISLITEIATEEVDLTEKAVFTNLLVDKVKTFGTNGKPTDFKSILDRIRVKNERK